jgi:hypothetical protein
MLLAAMLLNVAAQASAVQEAPRVQASTARSMQEFSQCFVSTQERAARPLWIVPNEGGGGRISNDGARGVSNPYRIRFTAGDGGNGVELFLARRDPGEEQALVAAVKGCS